MIGVSSVADDYKLEQLEQLQELYLRPLYQEFLADWQDDFAREAQERVMAQLAESVGMDKAQGRARQDTRARDRAERLRRWQDKREALTELQQQEKAAVMNVMVAEAYGWPGDYHGRASLVETACVVMFDAPITARCLGFAYDHIDEIADALLDPAVGTELMMRAQEALGEPDGEPGEHEDIDLVDPGNWPEWWDADDARAMCAHAFCPELPLEAWAFQSWMIMRTCRENDL